MNKLIVIKYSVDDKIKNKDRPIMHTLDFNNK
jgi:hypothetical protein